MVQSPYERGFIRLGFVEGDPGGQNERVLDVIVELDGPQTDPSRIRQDLIEISGSDPYVLRTYEDPKASILDYGIDLAVGVAGGAIWEGMRALFSKFGTGPDDDRDYTDAELIERAQRLLAVQIGIDYAKLKAISIDRVPSKNEASITFSDGTVEYKISIAIVNGLAVVERLHRPID